MLLLINPSLSIKIGKKVLRVGIVLIFRRGILSQVFGMFLRKTHCRDPLTVAGILIRYVERQRSILMARQ